MMIPNHYGQTGKLSVISWNLPDTLFMGDTVQVQITVQNTGSGTVDDSLFYLYYSTDAIGYSPLFLDTVFLYSPLNPGDTIVKTTKLEVTTSNFASGDNIVIVWPYRLSGEQGDTLQDSVYVMDTISILSPRSDMVLSYQFSQNALQVNTPLPLQRCELMTLDGKWMLLPIHPQTQRSYWIPIPHPLSETFYLLRLTFEDGTQTILRLRYMR